MYLLDCIRTALMEMHCAGGLLWNQCLAFRQVHQYQNQCFVVKGKKRKR